MTFIYLEIPKFQKKIHELESDYEKWLFAFKNLHSMQEKPEKLQNGIFKKLLKLAEITKMNERERSVYQESLKDYWDLKSSMDTYFKEGLEEGEKKKSKEMTKMMIESKEPLDKIIKYTGLSKLEIDKLK